MGRLQRVSPLPVVSVRVVCWRQPCSTSILMQPFTFPWTTTCMPLVVSRQCYLLDGELVGNRKALRLETLITDLEYVDDMALLANTWSDKTSMLESLSSCCKRLGLTISCKKTKSLSVLPQGGPDITTPQPIYLILGEEPVEVVSSSQYQGSIVQDDCGMETEIDCRICKASAAFQSLYRILWYQRRIQTSSNLRILNSFILPTLFYGLESTVLLQPHLHRLESFVIRCLRILLGLTVRQKKRHTTIRKMARQQRVSSILIQRRLRFLGHIVRMPEEPSKAASCVCSSGW